MRTSLFVSEPLQDALIYMNMTTRFIEEQTQWNTPHSYCAHTHTHTHTYSSCQCMWTHSGTVSCHTWWAWNFRNTAPCTHLCSCIRTCPSHWRTSRHVGMGLKYIHRYQHHTCFKGKSFCLLYKFFYLKLQFYVRINIYLSSDCIYISLYCFTLTHFMQKTHIEEPIITQLVKKFPALYWTTMFTTSCHWTISSVRWTQSTQSCPSSWIFVLMLSSYLLTHLPSDFPANSKLTTHLHLVLSSIMHGAIPPLPQYEFMAWCSVNSIWWRV